MSSVNLIDALPFAFKDHRSLQLAADSPPRIVTIDRFSRRRALAPSLIFLRHCSVIYARVTAKIVSLRYYTDCGEQRKYGKKACTRADS